MQGNKLTDDVEGNSDRVDPFHHQGKVACVMFLVLLLLSFLVIGIVTGLNFSKNSQGDVNRGLISDRSTPIPFQYRGLCSDGWIAFNNSCYLLVHAYETWELSKSVCHNHGAHLMVVNSGEQLVFISRVVQKQIDYWIGLKRDKTGTWSWENGEQYYVTSHFWDEDQPGHGGGRMACVYLKGTDTVGPKLLRDADCTSKRYFICERNLKKGV